MDQNNSDGPTAGTAQQAIVTDVPEEAVVLSGTSPDRKSTKSGMRIGLSVITLMIVLVAWCAISDRLAPYTDRGTLGGYVARIAPQISGQVVNITVEDNTIVDEGALLFESTHNRS